MTQSDYIKQYWQAAQDACADTPIFPILALAESGHESGWGESGLTKQANNFFGLKSTPSWEGIGGKFITMPTHEVVNGQTITVDAKFRLYDTPTDCFKNFVHFVTQPRYVEAGVMTAASPEEQIKCIAAGGYATDPNYAGKVTLIIQALQALMNEA